MATRKKGKKIAEYALPVSHLPEGITMPKYSSVNPIRVPEFGTGRMLQLNDTVGVRALHRPAMLQSMHAKLSRGEKYSAQKQRPTDGDPNPAQLLGPAQEVAAAEMFKAKLDREYADAEAREAAREKERRTRVAREEPKWRRAGLREQFAREREAAAAELAALKKNHEHALGQKLAQLGLLRPSNR